MCECLNLGVQSNNSVWAYFVCVNTLPDSRPSSRLTVDSSLAPNQAAISFS